MFDGISPAISSHFIFAVWRETVNFSRCDEIFGICDEYFFADRIYRDAVWHIYPGIGSVRYEISGKDL